MLFDAITILKFIFFICFFHAIDAYLLLLNRSSSKFDETPHNIDVQKDNKNVLGNFKRVLVKKIVPHGHIDYNLKYDAKNNALYKPLARLHKFKPISALVDFIDDKISKKLARHKQIYQDRNTIRDKYKNLKLTPFLSKLLHKQHRDRTSDADFITSELNIILNKMDSTMLSAERKLLKIINKMYKKYYLSINNNELNNIIDDKHVFDLVNDIKNRIRDLNQRNKKSIKGIRDIIQKKLNKKRGLRVEEIVHGRSIEMTDAPTPKPFDKWLPEYSLWNFWTYKQSLYEDQCPDQQVKLGDLCIWTPIHR